MGSRGHIINARTLYKDTILKNMFKCVTTLINWCFCRITLQVFSFSFEQGSVNINTSSHESQNKAEPVWFSSPSQVQNIWQRTARLHKMNQARCFQALCGVGERQIHWFSVSPTQCAADCTTLYFVKMNSSVQPMSFSSSSSSSAVVLAPFLYNLHFSLSPFLSSLSLQDVTVYVFFFLPIGFNKSKTT